MAQRAYDSGDYEQARFQFDGLLADPGADLEEKHVALHWRGRTEIELGDAASSIVSFETFLRQYPGEELVRSAQFNLGRAYEQSGQPDEAIAAYLGAIVPDDPVNVYIYERIGDIRMKTGNYTDTIAAYQLGINATDDIGFEVRLRQSMAQVELLLNESPAAAIAQYETILNTATIDSDRAKILRLLGQTYLTANDPDSAYETFLEAVNLYPEAYDSYLSLVDLVNADIPVDEFQRGLVDYHAEAYVPAIAAFERYLAQSAPLLEATGDEPLEQVQAPETEMNNQAVGSTATLTPLKHAAEATWLMALSMKALGQYNSAILTFRQVIDNFPTGPNWSEAHLELGKTLIAQGSYDRARAFLREFADNQPDDPLAAEALWRAAQLDLNQDLFEEAAVNHRSLADKHPTSKYAAEALYWAGQASYKLADYETAVDSWTKLMDTYPTSDLVNYGGYWLARALKELDREAEAMIVLNQVSENPPDYYVLRAQEMLSGQQAAAVPLIVPTAAELADEQAEAEEWLRQWLAIADSESLLRDDSELQSDQAFLRGDALLEIGLRDQALVEFETVKDNWWNNALALYQLANYFKEEQLGRLSIITAARLIFLSPAQSPEEAPTYIQRLYYPIYYEDVIFNEAKNLDLDPAILIALIRQESLFEQSAHSPAGARGLTQVMPATGEYVAERSGAEDFSTDQLWLPYISIRFGSWYISQQLAIFDDNQFAALAAYNAGPGNVLEWINVSDDLDIFVESIPFWESRIYIRTVYVNLAAYRNLYGAALAEPSRPNGFSIIE
jgi:soluble lytic murein transglycosylase